MSNLTGNIIVPLSSRTERNKDIKKTIETFKSSGLDLININTGSDYVVPLINFFKNRKK